VSVNLSASNLLDRSLPGRVAELLAAHAVPPSSIILEVTESVLLTDPDRSLAVVGALADLGLTVSIDDFGTGYSSLAYLRDLPVRELKLDRSFTNDLLVDDRTRAIVASTIDLAHQLGLRVVAEGVEQEETLRDLAFLGSDLSQGFLHSRPLPPDELQDWLSRTEAAAAAR
jgi:EAL domain-containing protein (putative c-di-GMP-specific phosphodiesterase class I)